MANETKSKGLFQDILALEKEYNYNVVQLKIKDDELERCRLSNRTLQETINKNFEEIKRLKADIRSLEESAEGAVRERDAEKALCEDVINKLTMKISGLMGQRRAEAERAENEMRRRSDELERIHARNSDEKDKSYMGKISGLQADLQQGMSTITRLNAQIQQLMNANMDLQNKIRETETKFIPELTVYKKEAATLKRTNADLTSSLELLKTDHSKLTQNLSQLIAKKNQLESALQERNGIIQRISSENAMLKLCVDTFRSESVNEQLKESAVRDCRCGELTRQNEVLREIVKSMKNEREARGAEEIAETEIRVERVENLLFQLKKSMLEKATFDYALNLNHL